MAGPWRRPVGAHAAPRRGPRRAPRAQPAALRLERVRPAPLSALFLGVIGGSLGLLAVLPAESSAPRVAVLASADAPQSPVDVTAGGTRPDEELRASRSRLRPLIAQAAAPPAPVPPAPPPPPPPPLIPGCDGEKTDLDGYANGRLPSSVLCTVPGSDEALRADAAISFVRLAKAYEAHFGKKICLTDGYRTLAQQKAVRRVKPRLAARPGTSEHGWGVAVDLACGVESFRSAQHAWMVQNAQSYGWYLPKWARRGGSKPEPWHWEYLDK